MQSGMINGLTCYEMTHCVRPTDVVGSAAAAADERETDERRRRPARSQLMDRRVTTGWDDRRTKNKKMREGVAVAKLLPKQRSSSSSSHTPYYSHLARSTAINLRSPNGVSPLPRSSSLVTFSSKFLETETSGERGRRR